MVQILQEHNRIEFDDGWDLYPEKYVLLGYTEEHADMSGVKSGVVLAISENTDRDAMWDLYEKYLLSKQHGDLYLFYFGEVYASGVYV